MAPFWISDLISNSVEPIKMCIRDSRFADLGFLIGILIYGYYAETFSFTPQLQVLAVAGSMIPLALGLMRCV